MDSTTRLPFDAACEVSQTCSCFGLRRAARVVTQLFDEALRPTGLRATQFTLLTALRLRAPVPVRKLAEVLVTDRTTLTRNLKPLERRGLVRISQGADRRVREVVLTDEGHAILARAHPLWEEVQEKVAEHLGAQRLDRLLADLRAVEEVAAPA